ncbi:MAG: hypothetical protein J0I12_25330 [Candidatus Eremiobacteraeota bacterium]|nr:hypothetical protein [Candidatus Eremiobacteraeota bacterium]
MINGIGGQGFSIPGVGATRPTGPIHTPPPVDDDAAFNFLESWTSSPSEKGQLSLNDMLKLQSSGGSEVPQTVMEKPPEKTEENLTREIEFLVKTNRNVFQAHGSLGSAGISDGWNLSH